MQTTTHDRSAGVLLASACGDALGAGYEFGPALSPDAPVGMIGGGLGPFAPGEWTDDTCMSLCVARAGRDHGLRSEDGLDAVAQGFLDWFGSNPPDIGIQTRRILGAAASPRAGDLLKAAAAYYEAHPDSSAGNGALMRTAPVALAHPGDPQAIAEAARLVNDLTHADPVSAEACVLWSVAVDHAIQYGTFDGLRVGLDLLSPDRAAYWSALLDEAETLPARAFAKNGWVVHALQAAWAAISQTPVPDQTPHGHLRLSLENAVRAGGDTDTVACIAGGLLGARWGASAVPPSWRRKLHGWPGLTGDGLVDLLDEA